MKFINRSVMDQISECGNYLIARQSAAIKQPDGSYRPAWRFCASHRLKEGHYDPIDILDTAGEARDACIAHAKKLVVPRETEPHADFSLT